MKNLISGYRRSVLRTQRIYGHQDPLQHQSDLILTPSKLYRYLVNAILSPKHPNTPSPTIP